MRVLDLTRGNAGAFGTMLLAELGADVIKVEPPLPAGVRAVSDARATPDELLFLGRGKRSITLDLGTRRARSLFLRLVAASDAVIEDGETGTPATERVSYRSLRRAKRTIVLTSISAFGLEGPRQDWRATELVLQAVGGTLAATGREDGPPQKLPGAQAAYATGLNAAIATWIAVYGVERGAATGVHLDISAQESFLPLWTRHISRYVYTGAGHPREQAGPTAQGYPHTVVARDGYFFLRGLRAEWAPLATALGLEGFATPEWSDPAVRVRRWDEIGPHFAAAFARRDKYEWFAVAAAHDYTFAPVDDLADVLASPQLAARAFFTEAIGADRAGARLPKLPFSFSGGAGAGGVPRLGEHNDAIFGGLLGLTAAEQAALASARVI